MCIHEYMRVCMQLYVCMHACIPVGMPDSTMYCSILVLVDYYDHLISPSKQRAYVYTLLLIHANIRDFRHNSRDNGSVGLSRL